MAEYLEIYGGAACLDFANTLDARGTDSPRDSLHTYADLVGWGVYAGFLVPATAARLRRLAPGTAMATAIELREAIFLVFRAIGRGDDAPAAALEVVQKRYAEAMAAATLIPHDGWRFPDDSPDRVWWPLAVSAVWLLTEGPLDRVKVCAAPAGCIAVFIDVSKNRSRRWCTTDGCGMDAKVRQQAERRRAAKTA